MSDKQSTVLATNILAKSNSYQRENVNMPFQCSMFNSVGKKYAALLALTVLVAEVSALYFRFQLRSVIEASE